MPTPERYQIDKEYYDAYSKSPERSETGKRYYQKHKESIKRATSKYYKANRVTLCNKEAVRNHNTKILVLTHYGGGGCKCVICGVDDIDCLTIDHINDDGHWHRKNVIKPSGNVFYKWLAKNDFPTGYQTLCANCNLKKEVVRRKNMRIGEKYV